MYLYYLTNFEIVLALGATYLMVQSNIVDNKVLGLPSILAYVKKKKTLLTH